MKLSWEPCKNWSSAWECVWIGCKATLFQESASGGKWTMYIVYAQRIIADSCHDVRVIWSGHLTPTFPQVLAKANQVLMQEWDLETKEPAD